MDKVTVTRNVREAADGILAPLCEKVGRFMLEEPSRDAIATMADYGVVIPFGAFQALYDATDDEATRQAEEQIKLLRGLVEEAFLEGYALGGTPRDANRSWEQSDSRQALEATNG